jgi:glycosyltransferase involved in cell wall biosynthesis
VVGERDDVARWLEGADVVVHASRIPEPFGQVVVEGMAAGAAVVATRGGGPSELVRDGVDGLLVAPDDVASMAAALRRLAGDATERQRLGAAARARVAELTDPTVIGAAVAAVHDRAAARRPR